MAIDHTPNWPGWQTVRCLMQDRYGSVYEIHRQTFGEVEKAALKVITIPHDPSEVHHLRSRGYDESSIRAILEYFHEPETVRRLYAAISEKKNLLDPFVVRCNMRCDDSCLIQDACRRKQTEALSQLIRSKNQELDNAKLEKQLSAIL